MPVERHEEVRVTDTPGYEHRAYVEVESPVVERREQRVVDPTARQRVFLARVVALIYLLFGILIALIGFRVVLLLINANPGSAFVGFIYGLTNVFLLPFFGLTNTPPAAGGVLEISSIIAMFVYALAAWVIVYLIRIIFAPSRRTSPPRRVTTYRRDG